MPRKKEYSRQDSFLFATSLEDMIVPDNPVRVVEAFVDSLDMGKLGFHLAEAHATGAPSYTPSTLLKLYFYGYQNRIRSSRRLEKECQRNIEMMWLLKRQTPSYHTISTFRTYKKKDDTGKELHNHRRALVQVFRLFNQFCDSMGLFGKETLAVDGTKIAAQNSKKRHVSEDKIERKLKHIDNRIEEYMDALDTADRQDESAVEKLDKQAIRQALDELENRKEQVLQLADQLATAQLEDPHLTQICLSDPDARMLPINNEGMMQIAYNAQSCVDDKHCLIAHYSVENQKDVYLLAPMAVAIKEELDIEEEYNLLADKGYHSGKGLQECEKEEVRTYVASPERSYRERPKGFTKEDFLYDRERNAYICPNKQELTTTGAWHEKHGRQGHLQAKYQLFRCSFTICSACPYKVQCIAKKALQERHGRTIERSEYEEATLANRRRILNERGMYKRRQAIVEHPFGTIKRSWGYYYTLLKGKEKVTGEYALVFACYNLRRAMSILGVPVLIEKLKGAKSLFLSVFEGFMRFVISSFCLERRLLLFCRV